MHPSGSDTRLLRAASERITWFIRASAAMLKPVGQYSSRSFIRRRPARCGWESTQCMYSCRTTPFFSDSESGKNPLPKMTCLPFVAAMGTSPSTCSMKSAVDPIIG